MENCKNITVNSKLYSKPFWFWYRFGIVTGSTHVDYLTERPKELNLSFTSVEV